MERYALHARHARTNVRSPLLAQVCHLWWLMMAAGAAMNEAIAEVLNRTQGHLPQTVQNKSVFADRLLSLWAWGLLSATNVQWLAEGVVMDQGMTQQCKDFADIGSQGAQPGNCCRDFLRNNA